MEKLDAVKYIGLIYGILLYLHGVLKGKTQFRQAIQGIPGFIIIALSIGLIVYTEQNKVEEDDKVVVDLILPIIISIMASDIAMDVFIRKLTYRYKVLVFGIVIALMISYPLIKKSQRSAILNAVLFMFLTFILLNVSLKDTLNRKILKGCNLSSFGKNRNEHLIENLNGLILSPIIPIIYVISLLVLYS